MKLEVTEISTTKILIFFTPLIFVLILGTFGETFPSHLWKDTVFDIVKKVTYGASVSLSNISWLSMGLCLDKCNVSDRKSTRISCWSRNIFFLLNHFNSYTFISSTHTKQDTSVIDTEWYCFKSCSICLGKIRNWS